MLALALLALPALVSAVPASTYPYVRPLNKQTTFAPLHKADNAIANSYIVTFKDDVTPETVLAHTSFINSLRIDSAGFRQDQSAGIQNVYVTAMKGYHGHFDEETVDLIRASPEIAAVEQDQKVWASKVQKGAPWGLARISHQPKLGFGTFSQYLYDENGGEGVDAYVIDTGINVKHVSFEGRASWGHTMPKNDEDLDNNGHGTHCAGTIASKDYGVAKKANVIAVKVLGSNGSGSMSDVVGGVDWAATSAAKKAKEARAEYARTGRAPAHKGSVANMSLGGGKSPALDRAINGAVKTGLHIAVAAGNDNADACNYSPAAAEGAVTVGASTLADQRAYFSNWGKCVDVFGPGLNIKSTWNTGDDSSNTISGTSMASPHVAGLLAYLLSLYPTKDFAPAHEQYPTLLTSLTTNPTGSLLMKAFSYFVPSLAVEELIAPIPSPISPTELKKAVIKLSSSGLLEDVGKGSPNLLVFNNYTSKALSSEEFWAAL